MHNFGVLSLKRKCRCKVPARGQSLCARSSWLRRKRVGCADQPAFTSEPRAGVGSFGKQCRYSGAVSKLTLLPRSVAVASRIKGSGKLGKRINAFECAQCSLPKERVMHERMIRSGASSWSQSRPQTFYHHRLAAFGPKVTVSPGSAAARAPHQAAGRDPERRVPRRAAVQRERPVRSRCGRFRGRRA
jgi:hypothetical protein